MKRRRFLRQLGGGALVAGVTLGAGCGGQESPAPKPAAAPASASFKPLNWKMVTTWPKNFPGLGSGANRLA